ncbi:hypothetical protein [Thalassotalea piscium]|uniref:Nuclear transport factor 2 family protein n=1 Tax=Thalassotalea piscium TaxID=1230533 RepID=A0A7X0NF11_9GAMM|nr:hypothetical protein [Thalassotalea piscium]MBB6542253.1 hypothetical protein [Thalassotalea piscium]
MKPNEILQVNIEEKLAVFFQGYITCFKDYDIDNLKKYYQLPCTLSTPDKLILVQSTEAFMQEFSEIFMQLKNANTNDFNFSQITYTEVNNALTVVGGQWTFINDQQEVFAAFFACYHILAENNSFKIVNVMSHEVENSVTFAEKLTLSEEQNNPLNLNKSNQ